VAGKYAFQLPFNAKGKASSLGLAKLEHREVDGINVDPLYDLNNRQIGSAA
jgi:hypothetical protein